ncbi:hypothetical protein Pmar_PMAR002476 [Perkinsus marinus ATCC 50983]|uniref:Uncharacterized protein n=1 Tax=Perkinsus marinus (strain ATCC 50983 / TXsc) TaxID=423536 RepID=C5KS87_PERM5|nr:hypothetical protein Pmar_PMAR002476 [Perkinsus marinus ATCC 50983]EER12668.1 hypothetical protein Pmar_PMAR002476 [Perkinsus marinus ATCC 50983]|eukprot:XP_002780873.1 hypothetical protein Pmar_PMAR002476 [Perkinsus marinus ATCC 50983]
MRASLFSFFIVGITLVVALRDGEYFYSDGIREGLHLSKAGHDVDISLTQRDRHGPSYAKTFRLKGRLQGETAEDECLTDVTFMQNPDKFRGDVKAEGAICFNSSNYVIFNGIQLDSLTNAVKLRPWRVGAFIAVGTFKGSVPQFGMTVVFNDLQHVDAVREGRVIVEGSKRFKEHSEYQVTFHQDLAKLNRIHITSSVKVEKDSRFGGRRGNAVGDIICRDARSTFYYRHPLLLVDIPKEVFLDGQEKWGQSVPMNGLRILLMREDDDKADAVVKSSMLKRGRKRMSKRDVMLADDELAIELD